jgi:hypothetical protein
LKNKKTLILCGNSKKIIFFLLKIFNFLKIYFVFISAIASPHTSTLAGSSKPSNAGNIALSTVGFLAENYKNLVQSPFENNSASLQSPQISIEAPQIEGLGVLNWNPHVVLHRLNPLPTSSSARPLNEQMDISSSESENSNDEAENDIADNADECQNANEPAEFFFNKEIDKYARAFDTYDVRHEHFEKVLVMVKGKRILRLKCKHPECKKLPPFTLAQMACWHGTFKHLFRFFDKKDYLMMAVGKTRQKEGGYKCSFEKCQFKTKNRNDMRTHLHDIEFEFQKDQPNIAKIRQMADSITLDEIKERGKNELTANGKRKKQSGKPAKEKRFTHQKTHQLKDIKK